MTFNEGQVLVLFWQTDYLTWLIISSTGWIGVSTLNIWQKCPKYQIQPAIMHIKLGNDFRRVSETKNKQRTGCWTSRGLESLSQTLKMKNISFQVQISPPVILWDGCRRENLWKEEHKLTNPKYLICIPGFPFMDAGTKTGSIYPFRARSCHIKSNPKQNLKREWKPILWSLIGFSFYAEYNQKQQCWHKYVKRKNTRS